MAAMKYSLIVPIYKNEESIGDLVEAIGSLNLSLQHRLEAVFVVDGSPDRSWLRLAELLPAAGLDARLVRLSAQLRLFCGDSSGARIGLGRLFRGDGRGPPGNRPS
jgi:hypothetical protein